MARLRLWLLPLAFLTLPLAILGLATRTGVVQDDLARRVALRLETAGATWAAIAVAGRAVTLSGTAPSADAQEEAVAAAAGVFGVASVTDESGLVPLISPFIWKAERSGEAVVLTGFVPSAEIRSRLREAVTEATPEARVDDRTELARGAPDDFDLAAGFALRVLADLSNGSVELADGTVTAIGTAIDGLRYEAALQALGDGMPAGLAVGPTDIKPPVADPFVWAVDYDGEVALIWGNTPSHETAEALAAATAEALEGKPTDDRTELASGEPPGFADMAAYGLSLLARTGSGKLLLSGSDLKIAGRAKTLDDYDALVAALAEPPPAGVVLTAPEIAPAIVQPYRWQATLSPGGVELVGFMPDADAKTELIQTAERLFGAARVTDRTRIADGAPRMDWIGATKFGLEQLSRLSGGSANVIDRTYSITGMAASSEAFEAVAGELERTLPASLELGDAAVTPPFASPYRFAVAVAAGGPILSGHAPDAAARKELQDAAASRFANAEIGGVVNLASGAPDGFQGVALAAVQAVSRLDGGAVEVVDRTVRLSGTAPFPAAAERIRTQLEEALPDGYSLDAAIAFATPQTRVTGPECQELLRKTLEAGGIQFDKGDSTVAPESEGLLDRLAAVIDRCPEARIEVGGHTDSGGSTRRNRDLSQARADAVVDYLANAGILRERLTAVGYGETRPIASNDNEEGRAQNRRIELTVQEP